MSAQHSSDSSMRPSDSHIRQHSAYSSQRFPTPVPSQRLPHQVNGLPQRPGTSMASSRISSSSRRPTSAHHTNPSYTSPSPYAMAHSQSPFPTPASSPGASMTVPSQAGYDTDSYNPTPLQVPSQSSYPSRTPGHSHVRVQSMSVMGQSGHPHPYLHHGATYPAANNITGAGMYMGQSQAHQGLSLNTVDLSTDPYSLSSMYGYTSTHGATVPSSNTANPSLANSSPLSPLSPLNPHFANSQSSASPSPTSTPGPTPLVAPRPRAGTVGSVPNISSQSHQLPPPLPHHHSQIPQHYSAHQTYPATPVRPFECDQCKLSFVRHHDLRRHKETHTGGRPHICTACGKSYTRKDALVRHQNNKQCGEVSSKKNN